MNSKKNHDCMDSRLDACPICIHQKIKHLEPGDCLELFAGCYDRPVTAIGLRGVAGSKITIRGQTPEDDWWNNDNGQRPADPGIDAVLTSNIDAETFRPEANRIAARKQAAGSFPGLYYIADEARLYLRDCQHVVIENLYFENCWPTALYLDNCQDITVSACQFRWGTFAIGATGQDTRHILVENCRWQQNPDNNGGHWTKIPWHRIHGDISNATDTPDKGVVNIKKDYRHFDGDFFSAWQIAGFVTLRRNLIEDAFNAIHLFNHKKNPSTELNLNVVIENNRFVRIRDNAIEPEYAAWNWVIRHNVLIDVYRWFSFEMERSGWFYIYGNLAWHTQIPGPGDKPPRGIDPDTRTGGSIFKLPKRHTADGPHDVFHNSFHLRERIAKKKRLAGLRFFNNAITFCRHSKGDCRKTETLFANNLSALAIPHEPSADPEVIIAAEKTRFTKDWKKLEIAFFSNVIHGRDRVRDLTMLGYPFGANSRDRKPGFAGPLTPGGTTPASFKLARNLRTADSANNASVAFTIETRGPQKIEEKGKRNIGAWQDNHSLFELSKEFEWISDPFGSMQPVSSLKSAQKSNRRKSKRKTG
jgi:hypothetical protein